MLVLYTVDIGVSDQTLLNCTEEFVSLRVYTGTNLKNAAKSVHYQYKH
jgi:hypothetical protein